MADLDFAGLNSRLLENSHALLREWLPGGSFSGREWVCGDNFGGKGRSFSVNSESGKWAEFNGLGGKGGDLISLYAYLRCNENQGQAFRELSVGTPMEMAEARPSEPATPVARITPPPADAPAPKPQGETYRWPYVDAAGQPIFFVLRWDKPDGEKSVRPVSWDANAGKWIYMGYPAPRPLLGLDELANRPQAPVMLVEGEKARDAARIIVGDRYVVATWPNGALAQDKADWAPLHGRKVHIWPDADLKHYPATLPNKTPHPQAGQLVAPDDQPGRRVALAIAALLVDHCPEVKIIDPGLDESRVDGWDAADALAQGWDWAALLAWARPRMTVYVKPLPVAAPALPLAPIQETTPAAPNARAKAAVVAQRGKQALGAAAMVELNIDDGEQVGQRETFAKVWSDLGLAATRAGVVANVDNVLRVLENRDEFRNVIWFDEFHQKVLTTMDFKTWEFDGDPRPWRDVDHLYLLSFMQRHLGMTKISQTMVEQAVQIYAHSNTKNEPQEWLNALVWDKVPRLEAFFTECFGVDLSEYSGAVSKNFWISMVARILRPGCQVDNMVILEGDQGAFKSSALRIIGGKWHMECRDNIFSKDFNVGLQGRSLVIINEWDKFKKTDAGQLKDIISSPVDPFRPLYEKNHVDHARTCIFVATTNKGVYLVDNTGARRYWPLRVKRVKKARIIEMRSQCFAEAVYRFRAGETWHEVPATEASAQQEERRVVDEWEQVIGKYLEASGDTTIMDVALDCLKIPLQHVDYKVQHRIGDCLLAIGWYAFTTKVDGRMQKLYKPKEE